MTHPTASDALALRDTMAAHARTQLGEDRARLNAWAWAVGDIARELAAAHAAIAAMRSPKVESALVRRQWVPCVIEGGV